METPSLTCTRCRAILDFYRPDLARVLGVTVEVTDIDAVINRHAVQPYKTWPLSSPQNGAQLITAAYQCNATPDHAWKKNLVAGSGVSVNVIEG